LAYPRTVTKENAMTIPSTELSGTAPEHERLRADLEVALTTINRRARRYRTLNTSFVLIALLSGGLVTLLGADVATGGTRVAQRVAETSTGRTPPALGRGWRDVCGLMAILAFVGTIATGVNSGLRIAERNTRAFSCAGIIDGLLTELPASGPAPDRTRLELARVRREYPEFFR
jgi:hypothetical protein